MATQQPFEEQLLLTEVIGPNGFKVLIGCTKDTEVQIFIEDLINTRWVVIEAHILRWQLGSGDEVRTFLSVMIMDAETFRRKHCLVIADLLHISRLLRSLPCRNIKQHSWLAMHKRPIYPEVSLSLELDDFVFL